MIGQKIKELRKELGISQKSFAKELGISQNYVSELENGKKKPSQDLISKLNKNFNFDTRSQINMSIMQTSKSPPSASIKEHLKDKVISDMQSLDVFKLEYDVLISVFVDICIEYQSLQSIYESSGCNFIDNDGRKSPLVAQLEVLRKDIVTYSDRLCLNPKTYQSLNKVAEEPKSKLADVLSQFG